MVRRILNCARLALVAALAIGVLGWTNSAHAQDPRVEAWDAAAEKLLPQNCNAADLMALVDNLAKSKDVGRIAKPKEVVRTFVEATTNLDEAKAFLAAAEKYWPGISSEDWAKDLATAKVSGYTYPRLIIAQDAKAANASRLDVTSFLDPKSAAALGGITAIKVEVTLTVNTTVKTAGKPAGAEAATPPGVTPDKAESSETFAFEMVPNGKLNHQVFATKLLDKFESGTVTFKYSPVFGKAVTEKTEKAEKVGDKAAVASTLVRVHHMNLERTLLEQTGKRHVRQCPNPNRVGEVKDPKEAAEVADALDAAWVLRSFYDDHRSDTFVPPLPQKNADPGVG